jgi:hypothetical protein
MSASAALSAAVGVFFVLYGIAVVVFRAPFTRFAKKTESTMYGATGRRVARRFTPRFIAVIGCCFIVSGGAALVALAFGHPVFPV